MHSNLSLSGIFGSRLLLALLLAISVSACGFHLRGNIPLPEGIQSMYLDAPAGNFRDQLAETLENAGAQLAENEGGADVTLRLTQVATDRTVGTLDERGKANSYNLRLNVKYVLQAPDNKIIRKSALKESRRYNFDPELVVESESEEAELQEDMEESIALRIVRQLSTVTDSAEKTVTESAEETVTESAEETVTEDPEK